VTNTDVLLLRHAHLVCLPDVTCLSILSTFIIVLKPIYARKHSISTYVFLIFICQVLNKNFKTKKHLLPPPPIVMRFLKVIVSREKINYTSSKFWSLPLFEADEFKFDKFTVLVANRRHIKITTDPKILRRLCAFLSPFLMWFHRQFSL
jgi:hypothetical protein